MAEPKTIVNFRLDPGRKERLEQLAYERHTSLGQLLREAVEDYIAEREREAWEAEARRSALQIARASLDPESDEGESLRWLDAGLDDLADAWTGETSD